MNSQELLEHILELKTKFYRSYEIWENNKESSIEISKSLNELLYYQRNLKENHPEIYQNCISESGLYGFLKPLEVISDHVAEQYPEIIKSITIRTDQTILNIIEQFQTQNFFGWLKSNKTQKIKDESQTSEDKAIFSELGLHFLPKIKAEEMGDILGLAFSGKLSGHYDEIMALNSNEAKTNYIKNLMAQERVYLNFDFNNLSITDVTDAYKFKKEGKIYSPRGSSAPSMIDSSYHDEKTNTLFCTVCTSDTDTTKQGAQLFELYKVLEEAKKNGNLRINGSDNLKFSIMFFNRGFFCTQDEEDVKREVYSKKINGKVTKDGYHHRDKRNTFEKIISDNKVSKEDMDKLNGLVTLSVIGNDLNFPRFPHTYDICDLIHCNPITSGCSTLWMYEAFEKLKVYENPEKTAKFLNFLLDFSSDTIDTLNKIKSGVELSNTPEQNNLIKEMALTYQKTITGISQNFTSYNLLRELTEEERNKINSILSSVDQFNKNHPNIQINTDSLEIMAGKGVEKKGTKIIETQKFNKEALKQKIDKTIEMREISEKKNQEKTESQAQECSEKEKLSFILGNILKDERYSDSYKTIDFLTKEMYSPDRKQTEKSTISEYIKGVIEVSKVMLDSGSAFTTVAIKAKDYEKEYGSCSGTAYISFMANGQKRNKFNQVLTTVSEEKADTFRSADCLIQNFMQRFTSKDAIKNMINDGGYEKMLNELVLNLENELVADQKKQIKP